MTNLPTPINQPRRKDRAKDDSWIKAYLQNMPYGMIATEYQGQPFLKPTQYVFVDSAGLVEWLLGL